MTRRPAEKQFRCICAYCGAEFMAESDRRRWCCNAHKQAAYRARQEKKAGGVTPVKSVTVYRP